MAASTEGGPRGDWVEAKKRSDVWTHLLVSHDKASVKCKHCQKIFKDHGSTTTLKYHLEHQHGLKFEKLSSSHQSAERKKNQPLITSIFAKEAKHPSPEEILANLAVDGISFHILANSSELHRGWKAQGLQVRLMIFCV